MPGLITRIARHIFRARRKSHSVNKTKEHNTVSTNPHQPQHEEDCIKIEEVAVTLENSLENVQIELKPNHNDRDIKTDCESSDNDCDVINDNLHFALNSRVTKQPSLPVQSATTVRAKRVLKELQNLMTVTQSRDHCFEVELLDDCNIFEWEVRLVRPYVASDLWRTMQEWGIEHIKFHMTFPDNFPFKPPFLRLVSPHIDNGFVMDGGAICLEVLTSQGWSSAYTIESLLVQVMAGMIQGGAVVSKKQNRKRNKLTKKRAEEEFRRISKIHAKYGWVSSDREDAV